MICLAESVRPRTLPAAFHSSPLASIGSLASVSNSLGIGGAWPPLRRIGTHIHLFRDFFPLVSLISESGSLRLRLRQSPPKDCCPYANARRAFFDSHFKIVRHAHGENFDLNRS